MTSLFLGIGVVNVTSIRKCIMVLEIFRDQSRRDDPNNNVMGPSIDLKARKLKYAEY